MEFHALREIMKQRWSARAYQNRPVAEKDIQNILESARWAPSGCNSQPWEFVLLSDPAKREKVIRILADGIAASKPADPAFPYAPPELLTARLEHSPVLIVACEDTRMNRTFPGVKDPYRVLHMSLAAALENMSLAAAALGLSLSWYTLGRFETGDLKKELSLPGFIDPCEILQLGYPKTDKQEKHSREPESYIHHNGFDPSKLRTDSQIDDLLRTRRFPDIYSGPRE